MSQTLNAYESKERFLAQKLFNCIPTIREYQFSTGHVAYDTIISLKDNTTILGEIKVRQFDVNNYSTYILQVDKLISLCNRAKKSNFDRIYYINFFESGERNPDFIIFNLTPRIKEWQTNKPIIETKWMNAETYKSTVNKIPKQVIMLYYQPEFDCRGILAIN